MAGKHSLTKKILYSIIILLVVLVAAELITSVFYYHRYGKRKAALAELFYEKTGQLGYKKESEAYKQKLYKVQQLVRPGSSIEIGKQIVDDMMFANHFIYAPWVDFRIADFNSKYVNTNGFSRATKPNIVHGNSDTLAIWFFGGSTMYGYNVADSETIPSAFAAFCESRKNSKEHPTIEIKNYGIPYYYSFQEYELFQQLLQQQKAPDIVIFLDGLNDFLHPSVSLNKKTFFSNRFEQMFLSESTAQPNTIAVRKPTSEENNSINQSQILVGSFMSVLQLMEQTAAMHSCKVLFVLQPVPFYNYPQKSSDVICSKETIPLFDSCYPQLERLFAEKENYLYLGNLLAGYTKMPFVDAVHYSPDMNRTIAQLILDKLNLSND